MRFSIKLLLLAAAVLVVAVASRWLLSRSTETATAAQEQNAPQRGGQQAVPVLASTAAAKDVPIIVRGIGSVQAYNMVTVRAGSTAVSSRSPLPKASTCTRVIS